jgi:hypothetical protein
VTTPAAVAAGAAWADCSPLLFLSRGETGKYFGSFLLYGLQGAGIVSLSLQDSGSDLRGLKAPDLEPDTSD